MIQQKESLLQDARRPVIRNLSDPDQKGECAATPFCAEIRGRPKCEKLCDMVHDMARKLGEKLGEPCVMCCAWGGKHLVLPCDEAVYTAVCRSPCADEYYLSVVANRLGMNPDDLMDKWKKLIPFGPEFAHDVWGEVSKRGNIPKFTEQKMAMLAEKYHPYELDVYVTGILCGFSSQDCKDVTDLRLEFAIKKDEEVVIGRLIVHQFNGAEPTLPIPIVGFVFPNSGKVEKLLESKEMKRFSEIVSSILIDGQLAQGKKEALAPCERRNHSWIARTTSWFAPSATDREKAREKAKRRHDIFSERLVAGCRVSTKSAPLDLLDTLNEDSPGSSWQKFKKMLAEVSNLDVYEPVRNVRPKAKRLWYRCLSDLSIVTENFDVEDIPHRLTTLKRSIERFSSGLRQYPPLDFESALGVEPSQRLEILRQDLLGDTDNYFREIKKVKIPFFLQSKRFDKEVVLDCLEIDADATARELIKVTRTGKIELSKQTGREAWRLLLRWYEKNDRDQDLRDIMEVLWSTPQVRKNHFMLDLRANITGVLVSLLTCGHEPVVPRIERIRRKAYDKLLGGS